MLNYNSCAASCRSCSLAFCVGVSPFWLYAVMRVCANCSVVEFLGICSAIELMKLAISSLASMMSCHVCWLTYICCERLWSVSSRMVCSRYLCRSCKVMLEKSTLVSRCSGSILSSMSASRSYPRSRMGLVISRSFRRSSYSRLARSSLSSLLSMIQAVRSTTSAGMVYLSSSIIVLYLRWCIFGYYV